MVVPIAAVMILSGLGIVGLINADLPAYSSSAYAQRADAVASLNGQMTVLPNSAGALPPGAHLVAPIPPGQMITFNIELAISPTSGWSAYAQELETPGSAEFHHTMSLTQFFQRFGPSPASVQLLLSYFQQEGLAVTPTDGPLLYTITGPASSVDLALAITLGTYEDNGARGMVPNVDPSLPSSVAADVESFHGLNTLDGPHPADLYSHPLSAPTCNAPSCITPTVMRTFYNETSLITTYSGSDEIGLSEMCDPLEPSSDFVPDVNTFDGYYGLPAPTITFIGDGATNCTSTGYPGWGAETDLDIQWAHSMAPSAPLLVCLDTTDPADCDQTFVNDDIPIGSNSWGGPWSVASIWSAAMAAGVDLLASSGDTDKYSSSTTTLFPASEPDGLAIGGTCVDPGTGGVYGSEGGWGESPCSHASGEGAGGGCNADNAPASYQIGTPGYPGVCTTSERGVPDLSMDADPGTGVILVSAGVEQENGGTSLACPMWAAVLDVSFQASGFTGFVDPYVYAFAKGADASKIYHDVTTGGNGYPATVGWDPVTGIGTPNIGGFANALSGVSLNFSVGLRASPATLTVGGTVYAQAIPVHGTPAYTYQWKVNGTAAGSAPNSAYWNWTPAHPATYLLSVQVKDSTPSYANSSSVTIVVNPVNPQHYTVDFFVSPTTCSITFNSSSHTSGGSGSYLAGQYTADASTCTNYEFHQWNSTGGVTVVTSTSSISPVTVASNGTLTAWYLWTGKKVVSGLVSFVVSPSKCEPITFDGQNENNGSSGTFTAGNYTADASACTSYTNPQWTASGALQITSGSANPATVWVKGNGTLAVTYTYVPPVTVLYLVNFIVSPVGCGPVSFNGTSQPSGSSAQFRAGTFPGHALSCSSYAFSNWTFKPTSGTAQVYATAWVNVSISSNGTLTSAYVSQSPPPGTFYTVNFVVEPTSCGPITFNGSSQANQTQGSFLANSYAAVASSCTGYSFSSWTAVGGLALSGSTSSTITVTVSGNGTLTATYKASSKTPTLSSVQVSPSSLSLATGGSETFTASPVCSGGACPAGTTYSWSLTSGLGILSNPSGSSVTFTAGGAAGTVTLFVNATLNKVTEQSGGVVITITSSPSSGSQSLLSSPLFWVIVIVIAAVVVAVVVFALTRKPKAAPAPGTPYDPQANPEPPLYGYSQ
jgi:subtilase family serine protease